MSIFEQRERAAEYGHVHGEELRFLALKDGLDAVARWAAEGISQPPEAGAGYAATLLRRLVAGASERDLVERIEADLVAAGYPELAGETAARLGRAVADADDCLHGRLSPRHEPAVHPAVKPVAHTHGFWGWTV